LGLLPARRGEEQSTNPPLLVPRWKPIPPGFLYPRPEVARGSFWRLPLARLGIPARLTLIKAIRTGCL